MFLTIIFLPPINKQLRKPTARLLTPMCVWTAALWTTTPFPSCRRILSRSTCKWQMRVASILAICRGLVLQNTSCLLACDASKRSSTHTANSARARETSFTSTSRCRYGPARSLISTHTTLNGCWNVAALQRARFLLVKLLVIPIVIQIVIQIVNQLVIPIVPKLMSRTLCRQTLCRQTLCRRTLDLGSLTCLLYNKKKRARKLGLQIKEPANQGTTASRNGWRTRRQHGCRSLAAHTARRARNKNFANINLARGQSNCSVDENGHDKREYG